MNTVADLDAADAANDYVLEARGLTKHFVLSKGGGRLLHAVDDVSFGLVAAQTVALVGESGSGKSTVARLLAQLYPPTSGQILLHGKRVRAGRGRRFRSYTGQVQMIFQDPFASLNPVRKIGYQLSRPLLLHAKHKKGKEDLAVAMEELLARVQLGPAGQFADKFPHELSGGQRQRVAIARALAAAPSVLLADEPVSMLDVSIRIGVLNLLAELKDSERLALLYITHDIASARYFADQVLVMYAAELVEGGTAEDVTQQPAHPYTQLLLTSAPDPDRMAERVVVDEDAELPSLVTPPTGCRFRARCPHAMPTCSEAPPRVEVGGDHWVRCWLHADGTGNASDHAEDTMIRARRQISLERT